MYRVLAHFLVGQSQHSDTTSQNAGDLDYCNLPKCVSSFFAQTSLLDNHNTIILPLRMVKTLVAVISLLDSHNTIILPLGMAKTLVAVITLTVYHHSWNTTNFFEVLELFNIKTIVGDLFWTSEALDNEQSMKVLEAPIKKSVEIYNTW